MEPQAPDLIKDVKVMYGLTQKDLEKILRIKQQAVSQYELGKVKKERHDVIQKLKDLRDGKRDDTMRRILEEKGIWDSIQRSRNARVSDTDKEAMAYRAFKTESYVKVAVSIPDPLFKSAEDLAKKLKKPRSRLYAEALASYVEGHDPKAITEKINAVLSKTDSPLDPDFERAQFETLSDETW